MLNKSGHSQLCYRIVSIVSVLSVKVISRISTLSLWKKSKNKTDKLTEVRKSVMTDMRRLAVLYTHFRESGDQGDGLNEGTARDNQLEKAIESY